MRILRTNFVEDKMRALHHLQIQRAHQSERQLAAGLLGYFVDCRVSQISRHREMQPVYVMPSLNAEAREFQQVSTSIPLFQLMQSLVGNHACLIKLVDNHRVLPCVKLEGANSS